MKTFCKKCGAYFDDEFRTTICPHETFPANDGRNNFAHHPESTLVDHVNGEMYHTGGTLKRASYTPCICFEHKLECDCNHLVKPKGHNLIFAVFATIAGWAFIISLIVWLWIH